MQKILIATIFLMSGIGCMALRADINGDGRVDLLDLSILSEEWLMADRYLNFDGSTGYVTVPNASALNVGTADFSISFWLKTSALIDVLACKYDGGETPAVNGLTIGLAADSIVLNLLPAATEELSVSITGACTFEGEWLHVVFVADRDGNGRAYINGVAGTSIDISSLSAVDFTNTEPLLVGSPVGDGLVGASASVDDIRIYKKALSAAEVLAIYNAGTPKAYSVFDAGAAAAAFNIDEGSGTTITDEINGLVGTFTGGVTWGLGQTGTAIIEQIAENIKTAVNAITIANGWNQTLTAVRPRRLDFSEVLLNDGKCFIWQGDHDAVENSMSMAAEWKVEFAVGALIIDSDAETDSIDTRLNQAAADIIKKLKEDTTRGGLAIDTLFPSVAKIDDAEFSGVIVNVIVHYRTEYADPYTLI